MVYRSRFVAVYILHCRWYDSDVGGISAGVGEGLAGVATVAVGGIAAGEEAESPLSAGVRRYDEATLSSQLRRARPPWGMIRFFVDTV